MKRVLSIVLVTLGLAAQLAAEDASALLARVDDLRSVPDMDFVLSATSFDGDQSVDSTVLWGWSQFDAGVNKTLVAFTEPASVKGRKMLMDGPTVYLLFPKTRNPIRLSPLQVLVGQSSNGDVARTAFSLEYEPTALASVTLGGTDCWAFDLAAKKDRQGSTYRRVKLWVEKGSLKPLAADFYGSGDAVLKHTVYGDWRGVGAKSLPFRLDITDGADPKKRTVLQYLRVGHQTLGHGVYRRDYLETWAPEEPR